MPEINEDFDPSTKQPDAPHPCLIARVSELQSKLAQAQAELSNENRHREHLNSQSTQLASWWSDFHKTNGQDLFQARFGEKLHSRQARLDAQWTQLESSEENIQKRIEDLEKRILVAEKERDGNLTMNEVADRAMEFYKEALRMLDEPEARRLG